MFNRYPEFWNSLNPLSAALLPLSGLYCAGARFNRYRKLHGTRARLPVPVVVVGNLTVGGTGKTPFVIWLAELLRQEGHRPGVLSRGYRGHSPHWPVLVTESSDPYEVGDEPALIARRTHLPVAAGPDRASAGGLLLQSHDCDVLICDDGLQHYQLHRDLEILLIDGRRRWGNGLCLPAGPLREPVARARSVDLCAVNGTTDIGELGFEVRAASVRNLHDSLDLRRPDFLPTLGRVHAVAGIGAPERFFATLRQLGCDVIEHAFPDHHRYTPSDLAFASEHPLVMTEKDAIKCRAFAPTRSWSLEVGLQPRPALADAARLAVRKLFNGCQAAGNSGLPGHQGPSDLRS